MYDSITGPITLIERPIQSGSGYLSIPWGSANNMQYSRFYNLALGRINVFFQQKYIYGFWLDDQ